MSNNIVEEVLEEKNGKRKKKKPAALIALIIVVAAVIGFGVYRYQTVEAFASGTKIDGVDVSGLSASEAVEKVTDECSKVNIKEDGRTIATVRTKYTYGMKSEVEKKLRESAIDPSVIIGGSKDYKISLGINGGIKETAKAISKKIPDETGTVKSKDAYIDYDTMTIVNEVYGNNLDYDAIAKALAKKLNKDPADTTFELDRTKYKAEPEVKASDLDDELDFAKKYLAGGLELSTPEGGTYTLSAKVLSKVIKYSKDGPKYDKDGAYDAAKVVASDYRKSTATVDTLDGSKTLLNYALSSSVDVQKTGRSIYNAAKNGGKGRIYVNGSTSKIGDHVEINLSKQMAYFVKDGDVVLSSSIVSGGPGHRTPTGIYRVSYKATNVTLKGRNADGSDYASPVSYWMPFNGGIGMHDANWRSSFGGSIYVSNGSHGCINMPPAKAAKMFSYVSAGTVVIVY
jgi:lipoprotein-anchoring transpeptidase ErfK/SrfK